MTEITTILLLSIAIIILGVLNFLQFYKSSNLSDNLKSAEKERDDALSREKYAKKTKDEFLEVQPGDRGIMANFSLENTSNDTPPKIHKYSVCYEVEILEVSRNKYKVKAIDYTTSDTKASSLTWRQSILDVINKNHPWQEKHKVEIVIDDAKRRSDKIDQILS